MRIEHMIIRGSDVGHTQNPTKPLGVMALRHNDGEKTISIGFSFCNPIDNFNKKLGAIKAIGRTNAKTAPTIPLEDASRDTTVLSTESLQYSSRAKNFMEVFRKKILDPK